MTSYHTQNNEPRDGGRVYASSGGSQNIYEGYPPEDNFRSGEKALVERLYREALARFEAYLTICVAGPSGQPPSPEDRVQTARARFFAALSLLGGARPEHKSPAEIEHLLHRLRQVEEVGPQEFVFHQARVLAAVVVEDYYVEYGLEPPGAPPAELAQSLEHLDDAHVDQLATHLADAKGKTRLAIAKRIHGTLAERQDQARPVAADQNRPAKVRKYFIKTPDHKSGLVPAIAGGVGLLLIVIGIAMRTSGAFLPLLAGAGLLYLAYNTGTAYLRYRREFDLAEPKPSDQEMDAWLRNDVAYLQELAGRQLRLDPRLRSEGGSLLVRMQVIVGVPRGERPGVTRVRVTNGKDGRLRANTYEVLIVFLTANLVSTYRCLVDFHTGHVVYDENREHHYRDVVGITSNSIPVPKELANLVEFVLDLKQPIAFARTFTLSIIDGQSFSVDIGYSGPSIDANGEIAWGNDKAVAVIQRMVRSQRGGV